MQIGRLLTSALACALLPPTFAQQHAASASTVTSPIPIPAVGAYFGAYANPVGTPGPSDAAIESDTETLEAQIGRNFTLHMHYYHWSGATSSAPSFPDPAMQWDVNHGRIPVVTWACGDTNQNVVNGMDDALIDNAARAVALYGAPIFLRWYWEMNLAAGANGQDCMGTTGAPGYIAAWRHIHDRFITDGVTNVTWLWNPAASPLDHDPAPWYPGAAYVDWIGFDGYDKFTANDFGGVFELRYNEFAGDGKPFLIAETGECPNEQVPYLDSAQTEIEGASIPGNYAFPLIKGFMYLDAPGHYTPCQWTFGPTGLSAFSAMGLDPWFRYGNDTIFRDGFEASD